MASSGTRTLKLKFDGDTTGLASATKDANGTLERFNKTTEDTRSRMDSVGEGSENLADSSSLATGALGALASGFELVGLEGYAERLQQASLATDFMSGVGDSLTLVTQKLGLATAKTKVVTVAQTVATKAQSAATRAQIVVQKALNLAMRANPVLLVVAGVAALIAVLVLAYKKSTTFRRIVDGAFRAVRNAAEFAFNWVKRNWPLLLAILTGPFGIAVYTIAKNWDRIRSGVSSVKDYIVGKFNSVVGFFQNIPSRMRNALSKMWDVIPSGFKAAMNTVIGGWNNLSFTLPEVDTHIPGVGKVGGWTISTPNVGYLARGGPARAGRTYVVGENGPEVLTMAGASGYVTPNHQLGGDTIVRVYIGDQELRGIVRSEVSESHRDLKRKALQR